MWAGYKYSGTHMRMQHGRLSVHRSVSFFIEVHGGYPQPSFSMVTFDWDITHFGVPKMDKSMGDHFYHGKVSQCFSANRFSTFVL